MFAHLTLAVRDRIIEELKTYWADDPRYVGLANNIQGKYSFEERPQFGIIVRTGGASNVVLSAYNFIGTVEGYVSLASVKDYPSHGSIEWVREDPAGVRQPGIYHVNIYDAPNQDVQGHQFNLYAQKYERRLEDNLMFISNVEIQLLDKPIENSLRIIEYPSGRRLSKTEYTYDPESSVVTLTEPLPRGLKLNARYTVDSGQIGPFLVRPAQAYREIIPGAVLAFGRKLKHGDQQIVLVGDRKEPIYEEYGGRWDVSVDLELIARDPHSQADISDRTVVWIWSELRKKLTDLGIDISDVSLGGEGEEAYDDNGDDYFYTATISFTVQTNWFAHVPLVIPIYSYSDKALPIDIIPATVSHTGIGDAVFGQSLL